MLTNLFRFIGVRSITSHRMRTLVSVLSVAAGVALFIAISLINESTLSFFKESVMAVSGKAQLTVSAGETGFDEKIQDQIEKIKEIAHIAPIVEARAWLTGDPNKSENLVILGVDLLQEKAVRSYKATGKKIIGDSLTFITQPDSLILTEQFAKTHSLKIDDKLTLSTAHGKVVFTVRGVLSPTGLAKAYGGAMAVMDIDAARINFGREGKIDRLDIVVRDDTQVLQVAEKIKGAIGSGFTVERPELQSEQMERMFKSFQVMLHFFSTLSLLVGVFLIGNSVSIAVAERRKEIGTLRALGVTRIGVLVLFLSEAIAMGVIGALFGAFSGRGLASLMVSSVAHSMTESSMSMNQIQPNDLHLSLEYMGIALLIGVLVSVVASFIPSYKATLVPPIEAMKFKEVGENISKKGFYRYSGWVGLVLIGLVVIFYFIFQEKNFPIMNMLTLVAAVGGTALVGTVLVTFMFKILKSIFPFFKTSMVSRLALENLLRNPKKTYAAITTLIVGFLMVIFISSVNHSFKQSLRLWTARILQADLFVSSTGTVRSARYQQLHEEVKEKIQIIEGVESVYAIRYVHMPYDGNIILLKVFDEPPTSTKFSVFDVQDRDVEEAGRDLYYSKDPTIMVSKSFTIRFKKKTGDVIELLTPNGLKKFRIVATVIDFANPTGVFYMSRDLYRKLFKDPLVSAFAVKLKDVGDFETVKKSIDQAFGPKKMVTVVSNAQVRTEINHAVDNSFSFTHLVEVCALLVALFGILNILLISVLERMRELGTLRAVGMEKNQMIRMIFLESLIQGTFGAVVAVVLGSLLSYFWISKSFAYILGWTLVFYYPWTSIFTIVGLGIAVAILAAWYPARRAARLEIIEAVSYE